MKILRAFQVINKDGIKYISSVFYEVDENGNVTNDNETDSFVAIDSELVTAIESVEEYIKKNRLN